MISRWSKEKNSVEKIGYCRRKRQRCREGEEVWRGIEIMTFKKGKAASMDKFMCPYKTT